jgi:hypothetical protein
MRRHQSLSRWTCTVVLVFACNSLGCSYAVTPSRYARANSGSEVVALFALDMLFRTIAAAVSSASAQATDPAVASARYWNDPDDWVAECVGPTRCEEHRHLQCRGYPGACDCRCVVSKPRATRRKPQATRPTTPTRAAPPRVSRQPVGHTASRTVEVASPR